MPDLAGAYVDAQRRMTAIARTLSAEQLGARVPACPDWTVKDLIAHVTSIASDLTERRFPPDLNPVMVWDPEMARRREEWVARAVETRRDTPAETVLEEWDKATEILARILRGEEPAPPEAPPLFEWIVVTDIGVHLHDLHGAVGTKGDRDALATGLSLRSYVEGMRFRVVAEGLPTLRIRAGSRDWTVGEGEPAATLTGEPFELSRAASGRRSPAQVRALDWDGDPEPFLTLFYPYGARADALVE